MLKKPLHASLISGILIIAMFINSTVTYAATGPLETLTSGTEEVTLNNITYNHYSEVSRFEYGVTAKTFIRTSNGQYVPANTLGLKTCLYNSSGQIVRQTAWVYNSSRVTGMSAQSSVQNTTGIYYAMGEVEILSGSTWRSYTTHKTGTLSYSPGNNKFSQGIENIEFNGYKTNESNKTYGSGLGKLIYGEAPDLISVVGSNGMNGYAYYDEMNVGKISSPVDDSLYLETGYPIRVPVYMEDGITLIDYFEIEEGDLQMF